MVSTSPTPILAKSAPSTPPANWLATVIRWVIYLTLLITPFIFTWVNEELFEFPKMLLVYGLAGVGLSLAIVDHALRNDWRWPKTKFDWLIAAFVASQVLSTVFSIHPRTSWLGYYTRFNGGLLSTLAYVSLFYLTVRYFSARQLVRLSKVILVAGIVVALYALPEHFGHSPSCLLITKEFGVSCWVQDVQTRVYGTFGQPNWLAAYLITLMPLTLAWLSQTRKQWLKIVFSVSWLVMFGVVLFTKSRSGLIGLGVGTGVWGGLYLWHYCWQFWRDRQHQNQSDQGRQKHLPTTLIWLKVIAVLTIALVVEIGSPWTPSLASWWQQRTTVSPIPATATPAPAKPAGTALETGGTESGTIRKIVWSGAIAVWRRYPILGSGVETFAYSYYQDRPPTHNLISEWDFLYNKAHNELLNYLATTGLVGLGTYLALWIGMAWWIIRWLQRPAISPQDSQQRVLAMAWVAGLTGQFVSNFLGFSTVMITVLFWIGLASLAQWLTAAEQASQAAPDHLTPTSPAKTLNLPTWFNYSLALAACLAGGLFIWQIGQWWAADRDFTLSKALFQAGQYQLGMTKLESAINQSPDEALFWDELADQYSVLAVGLKAGPKASESSEVISQLADAAVQASDHTLVLNPRHLDFYKTRSRVFTNLAGLDSSYYAKAAEALEAARLLAPTDPKLVYHLGLVEIANHQTQAGLAHLELAVQMKPNYLGAWFDLGKAYEQASQSAKARETYEHILTTLSPNNPEVTARLKAVNLIKNSP